MEFSSCVLCGSGQVKLLFPVGPHDGYMECAGCHLVRREPLDNPSELVHFYEAYGSTPDRGEAKEIEAYHTFERRIIKIEQYRQSGRVLDVGCGLGFFLKLLRDRGWSCYGVDLSKYAAAYAHRRFGLDVGCVPIEEMSQEKGPFDLILFNHTLEHFSNPRLVLERCWTLLDPEGLLFINVPNFDSLPARLLKSHWRHLRPDEHLYQFTPQTLTALVTACGFKVREMYTLSGLFDYARPLTMLLRMLANGQIKDVVRIGLEVVKVPIAWLKMRTGIGEGIVLLADKLVP